MLIYGLTLLILGSQILAAPAPSAASTEPQSLFDAAGDLEIGFRSVTNGIQLTRLADRRAQQELLAAPVLPLFAVTLHQVKTGKETTLQANAGWRQVAMQATANGFILRWEQPSEEALQGVAIEAAATHNFSQNAFHWQLRVVNGNSDWGVWRVVFPQLAVAELGKNASVFFPRGPGETQAKVWQRPFTYKGDYPGGWCAMQFMAAYSEAEPGTGLYLGVHDPWGSVKNLVLESKPDLHQVRMRFDHPAPNMGKGGQGFELSGEAVWQLLRGDWYEAAQTYRQWARQSARWWPRLGTEGRTDTPRWMRQLNAWAQTGGAAADCVAKVQRFQNYLGVPTGFHWYSWHQIPFDNDYPHYFPAKSGFTEGVAALQQSQVFVMPYINGRLWDTHDRGADDFAFSAQALSAATKDSSDKPQVESYGSKETNNQPVKLAVMCPWTPLWQGTVSNIVLRLLKDCGTRAVYIDQVAAAPPALCMDPSHGHPLGGGHWWNEGYWRMLDQIRQSMPPDAMLTTECNGEPFVRWFDGYLTWHWQYDGQVPAFPLVYGGAIQMFGRAYRGGATKDLALRMKAGQQLVYGEQLGWLDPGLVQEKENGEFFRQLVQLRARCNRYFYAGEMGRPPKFLSPVPRVKADWQWSGEWWVTTDAVLTGAWRIPAEHRSLLLFVNVSDAPVEADLKLESAWFGSGDGAISTRAITIADDRPTSERWSQNAKRPMRFAPRQAYAWELTDTGR